MFKVVRFKKMTGKVIRFENIGSENREKSESKEKKLQSRYIIEKITEKLLEIWKTA